MKLYQFIWHEFCDWYIELSKEPLKAGGERQAAARWVLVNVFDKMLRLLHPFMPFVSEEIWQVIRLYLDEPNLAAHLPIAKYPEPSATNPLSPAEELAMNHCIEATEAINSLRSLLGWCPSQRVDGVIMQRGPLDENYMWMRKQIEDEKKTSAGKSGLLQAMDAIDRKMGDVEYKLVSEADVLSDDKYFVTADRLYLNFLWLSAEIGTGGGDVHGTGDWGATETDVAMVQELERQLQAAQAQYQSLMDKDVPAYNQSVAASGGTPLKTTGAPL